MKKILLLSMMIILAASCNFLDTVVGITDDDPIDNDTLLYHFFVKDRILSEHEIVSLAFGNNGDIWFGTRDRELIHCDSEDTVIYNSSNSIINELHYCSNIRVDSRGTVWFRNEELVSLNNGAFTRYTEDNSPMPIQDIRSFEIDSQNRVWVISCKYDTGGVVCIDEDEWTVYSPHNTPLTSHLISDVTIDSQDKIWLSAWNVVDSVYMASFDQSNWELHRVSDLNIGIPHVSNIYTDRFDDVYGTVYQTLITSSYCDLHGMFSYDMDNKNCEFLTGSKAMLEVVFYDHHYFDLENRLWCNMGAEVSMYDGSDWHVIDSLAPDPATLDINQFLNAPNGDLWVMSDEGVYIYGEE